MENLVDSGILTAESVETVENKVSGGKRFTFTRRAHRRAINSFYPRELEKRFAGQFDVDLLEVELAILALEQVRGKRQQLQVDVEAELVPCDLGKELDNPQCIREFLPIKWLKGERWLGFFNGQLGDNDILAVCVKCQDELCRRVEKRNDAIVAACERCKENVRLGKARMHNTHASAEDDDRIMPYPQFLSSDGAYAELKELQEAQKELEARDQMRLERSKKREENANKVLGKFASNVFKPQLRRGMNAKYINNNGRGNGNGR